MDVEHGAARDVTIDHLPEEMLMYIFRFLDPKDVYGAVSEVCERWRSLARSPLFSREMALSAGDGVDTVTACTMLKTFALNLRVLRIHDRQDTTAILCVVACFNRQLRTLDIRRCSGTSFKVSVSAKLLRRVVRKCSELRSVTVRDTLGCSRVFLKELSYLPHLRKVNLGYSQRALSGSLNLGFYGLRLDEWQAFCTFFASTDAEVAALCSGCPHLTELKLNATEWSDAAVFSILQLKQLEALHVRFGLHVTAASLANLPQLQNLRSLELSIVEDVTSNLWLSLFGHPTLQQLTALGLSMCAKIDDTVVGLISSNCTRLERIRLAGCTEFTESGFEQVITRCARLVDINVYFTRWCLAKCFPLIPVHLPRLRRLVFGPIPLPNEFEELSMVLCRAMPGLKLQTHPSLKQ